MSKKQKSKTSSTVSSNLDDDVSQDVIDAVDAFEFCASRLELHKQKHATAFDEYQRLVEEYNAAREHAEKLTRAHAASVGPFRVYSMRRKYDAKSLVQLVGEDVFQRLGGSITTVTVYTLDNAEFEKHVEKLPTDIREQVCENIVQMKTPKALKV